MLTLYVYRCPLFSTPPTWTISATNVMSLMQFTECPLIGLDPCSWHDSKHVFTQTCNGMICDDDVIAYVQVMRWQWVKVLIVRISVIQTWLTSPPSSASILTTLNQHVSCRYGTYIRTYVYTIYVCAVMYFTAQTLYSTYFNHSKHD